MSGYLIYHYNITDHSKIDQLGPLSRPILEKYEGEIVSASGVRVLEGSTFTNIVIYKFKSMEIAKAFYECEESKALSKLRNEVTQGIVLFTPGYHTE